MCQCVKLDKAKHYKNVLNNYDCDASWSFAFTAISVDVVR